MSLENLTEIYKAKKEQLLASWEENLKGFIAISEKLISLEESFKTKIDTMESRLDILTKRIDGLKREVGSISMDVKEQDQRIRDLE